MNQQKIIGQAIRRIRLEREMSQEELALKAGIARSYMSGLENGWRNPTVAVLDRVAKGLGVRFGDLLTERLYTPRRKK